MLRLLIMMEGELQTKEAIIEILMVSEDIICQLEQFELIYRKSRIIFI